MSDSGTAAIALDRIRGAIFDLGNVLIRLRPLDEILRITGIGLAPGTSAGTVPVSAPVFHGIQGDPIGRLRADPIFDHFERGRASEAEFLDALRRAFAVTLDDDKIRSLYEGILGEPEPGMEEILEDLRDRGIRVVGLTDTSPMHLVHLDRYAGVRALEQVVASCRTSLRKPEAGAYRAALEVLGTEPSCTLFVDDQQANVEGARALGLQGVVFRGAADLRTVLNL